MMPIGPAANTTITTVNNVVLGGPLLIIVAIFLFITIFISIPFVYRKLIKIFGWLGMTFIYFLKGLAGLLSFFLIYFSLKSGTENAESILPILKWIGIAIICYAAIASAGYLLTYVWNKVWLLAGKKKKRKEEK